MSAVVDATTPSGRREAVSRAVETLVGGGTVILPTDTVYGLAASPDDPQAVARLFALKGRSADVPVAVLCAGTAQALSLADTVSSAAALLAARHWPGSLTLVLPRRADLDWDLGEPAHTIGVRCPDHPIVAGIADRIGPIATTSANRHGEPTPTRAEEAASSLTAAVDLVIDGGELDGSASTVVDATGTDVRLLRQGSVVVDS